MKNTFQKNIKETFWTFPSYITICRCFWDCKHGKFNFKDNGRIGRPSTASSKENVEKVKVILKDTPYISYHSKQHTLNFGSTTIFKLRHEGLKVNKPCSRWGPHERTEEQKQRRVSWCLSRNVGKIWLLLQTLWNCNRKWNLDFLISSRN